MKKIFFTFLTVLLATLAAQAATDYGFEVAGVTVTSANCNNIVTNYITGGTVYYVPSSNTLYMNNVTITMTGDYNRVINNLECSGLKVEFSGTCNLYARDAAVVRIRRTTTLSAPSASENGIWLATRNVFDLIIQGPGTFNISSTNNTAIEDEENGSASHVDIWHNVYFNNVNAVLSSGGNSVVKRLLLNFKAGSSVRFKATNNSSYPVIDYCQNWDLYGNEWSHTEPIIAMAPSMIPAVTRSIIRMFMSATTMWPSSTPPTSPTPISATICSASIPSAISPRPMSTTAQRRTLAARAFPISRASSTSLP